MLERMSKRLQLKWATSPAPMLGGRWGNVKSACEKDWWEGCELNRGANYKIRITTSPDGTQHPPFAYRETEIQWTPAFITVKIHKSALSIKGVCNCLKYGCNIVKTETYSVWIDLLTVVCNNTDWRIISINTIHLACKQSRIHVT